MHGLEQTQEKDLFSFLTREFVFRWFGKNLTKEAKLLFAYCMECFLEGYLYITIEDEIFPDPRFLYTKGEKKLDHEEMKNFCHDLKKGFADLDEIFFERAENIQTIPRKPFILKKNSLYLQKSWLLEKEFFAKIFERTKKTPLSLREEIIRQKIENNGTLDPLQTQAIQKALMLPLSIISGGPGSGKTFTIVYLVKFFLMAWPLERNPKILVMAPTGKATQRLEEFFKAFSSFETMQIEIKTVHAHLKIRKNFDPFSAPSILDADLVIVDEASMIDLMLAHLLLKALPQTCRLVFVGDPDQLSPVELGSFFSDLCQNQTFHHLESRLQGAHRFPVSWSNLFDGIRKKESTEILALLQESQKDNIFFHEFLEWDSKKILELLFASLEQYLYDAPCVNEEAFLKKSLRFRILSPLRKGLWGVEMINNHCLNFCQKKHGSEFFVPILITQNDYQLQLFNGTTGGATYNKGKISKPYFTSGKTPNLPQASLDHVEIAYAISVHKSQGSEYENLLLILPPGSEVFGREMLYTALSRAQKKITIISNQTIIREMMERSSKKFLESP